MTFCKIQVAQCQEAQGLRRYFLMKLTNEFKAPACLRKLHRSKIVHCVLFTHHSFYQPTPKTAPVADILLANIPAVYWPYRFQKKNRPAVEPEEPEPAVFGKQPAPGWWSSISSAYDAIPRNHACILHVLYTLFTDNGRGSIRKRPKCRQA